MVGYALAQQQEPPRLPAAGPAPARTPPAVTTGLPASPDAPPAPAVPAADRAAPPAPTAPPAPAAAPAAGPVLGPARPTVVSIPSIDVTSPVNEVGLQSDGSMQVPQPGPLYDQAAWYGGSPTPGELGASVIIGHIDSYDDGPSVFYRLPALRPGEQVHVDRADGTRATFQVDTVEAFAKAAFPLEAVYGATPEPTLRLITCGGAFDEKTKSYRDNIVAFAHLVGAAPAG